MPLSLKVWNEWMNERREADVLHDRMKIFHVRALLPVLGAWFYSKQRFSGLRYSAASTFSNTLPPVGS